MRGVISLLLELLTSIDKLIQPASGKAGLFENLLGKQQRPGWPNRGAFGWIVLIVRNTSRQAQFW